MKTPAEIIKGIECCHLQPISNCSACPYGKYDTRGTCSILLAQDACEVMRNQSEQITRSQKDLDNLEYTLAGVMHSVDKWLDGEELEQDEVNRAATMREKTLQIIEAKDAENEKLRAELNERRLIITKRKEDPGNE